MEPMLVGIIYTIGLFVGLIVLSVTKDLFTHEEKKTYLLWVFIWPIALLFGGALVLICLPMFIIDWVSEKIIKMIGE